MKKTIPSLPVIVVMALLSGSARLGIAAPDDEAESKARRDAVQKVFKDDVTPFLKTYCLECHGKNNREKQGDVSFQSTFNRPGAGEFRKQWQLALVNVKTHAMPPPDAKKQPTDEERQKFIEWVPTVKFLSTPDPGAFVIRRLTKVEYGNTLRDLLGVDPAIAAQLPEDVPGEGYLNTISPLQSEQYLELANEALNRALGPKDGPPTERQKQLFGETPAPGSDARLAASKVARSFARSAYRRPPSDDEVEVLLRVFDLGQDNKLTYLASLRLMVKAVLVSPQFLFITPEKETPTGQSIVPLDDYQVAARLSYFLWSTMPDAELAALADGGKLHEPEILRAQVKRLIEDPRSQALFDGFGVQWLGIGGLKDKTFDPAKFPEMTSTMRATMHDEVRLFFESIVHENRSVIGFVDSDYTFLNEGLAKIYGLDKAVSGPQMRKVQLTDANRGGVLGMPGILAMTSFPERTSAVKRGVWVLEQVLGEHVPPPPANVPALEKQDQKEIAKLTLRQRTELHRTDAVCANCHKILDPIGFGLENFDAIGRWRDKDDSGGKIDAAGELPGGQRFTSPKELKAIIAGRKDEVVRNLAEKLLSYALCRPLEGYDEFVVDRLMENLAKDDNRMQTLITEVVISYPFTHRRVR